MSDAEAPDLYTQGMGVAQVLELFEPPLEAIAGNIEAAKERLMFAQHTLEEADAVVLRAQEARKEQAETVRRAHRDVHSTEQWLANERNAAVAALHTLDVPASKTFVGQTLIEGGSEEEAEGALKELHKLTEAVEPGAKSRLIVLGSFPTKAALVDGDGFSYNGVSFVDLEPASSDGPPLGLHREIYKENRGHFLRVVASRVTQIPFNKLSVLEGTERDTTQRQHYVNANPLDLRVVTTEEELAQLTWGEELLDLVPKKYGAITVGTEEEDSFPPTVIAGEAAGKFTEWLARNEWMRTMVYVATADRDGQAEHVPELPEDSKYIAEARVAFRQRLSFQVNRMAMIDYGTSSEKEAVTSLRSEPLLSPHVKLYLGISDEMITEWLIEDLKSNVTVETPSTFNPDRPVKFKVDNYSQLGRHFGSIEELCDFIDRNFKDAGFDIDTLPQVAKGIKTDLLERQLRSMSDYNRADRKVRAKIAKALDDIQLSDLNI